MASGGSRRPTFLATPAFQTPREELRAEQQAEFLTECRDTPSPRGPSAGLCGEVTREDASQHGPDHLPRCARLYSHYLKRFCQQTFGMDTVHITQRN